MKVNIISNRDGWGLERDADILLSLLTEWGHTTEFCSWKEPVPLLPRAQVAVYCEVIVPVLFMFARYQWLFINPEWCFKDWQETFGQFQYLLCKTHDAQRRMREVVGEKAVFTNFTCRDLLDTSIKRQRKFLHVAGDSRAKNTDAVIKAWQANPDLPPMTLVSRNHKCFGYKNIIWRAWVPNWEITRLFNSHIFHVCPSQYEGYGHYIHEAQTTKAVILTTDAPPMDEFGTPAPFRVPVSKIEPREFGQLNYVDSCSIVDSVRKMIELSDAEVEAYGEEARQRFFDDREDFHKRFGELLR